MESALLAMLRALCIAGVLAGALHAQSSITGVLQQQRGDSLLPLAGCTVYAQSIDNGPLVGEFSDDKGRFVLQFPPDARVSIGADCPGYRLASVDGRRGPPPTYDCSGPGPCGTVELAVEPLGVIDGHTVDPNGAPVEGVRLFGRQIVAGRPTRAVHAVSDDRGYFRLFHLSPGTYQIAPTLQAPLAQGVHWEADTFEIEIGPGEVRSGVQVRYRLNQGVDFSGRIDGLPPGTTRVTLHLRNPNHVMSHTQSQEVEVDEQGRFRLAGIPRGRYEVDLWIPDPGQPYQHSQRAHLGAVDVNGESEAMLVRRDPIRVSGAVQIEAPERDDLQRPAGHPLHLRFQREDGFTQGASANAPDYRFAVQGLRPGRYIVAASGPGARLERRSGEDEWEPFSEIELHEAQEVELDLRVRFEMGRLTVRVKPAAGSDAPEASHYVVGFRRNGFVQLYPADQHGRLLLNYFAGGEYEICAWPEMSMEEANDPETWSRAGAAVRKFLHEESADMEIALTAAR